MFQDRGRRTQANIKSDISAVTATLQSKQEEELRAISDVYSYIFGTLEMQGFRQKAEQYHLRKAGQVSFSFFDRPDRSTIEDNARSVTDRKRDIIYKELVEAANPIQVAQKLKAIQNEIESLRKQQHELQQELQTYKAEIKSLEESLGLHQLKRLCLDYQSYLISVKLLVPATATPLEVAMQKAYNNPDLKGKNIQNYKEKYLKLDALITIINSAEDIAPQERLNQVQIKLQEYENLFTTASNGFNWGKKSQKGVEFVEAMSKILWPAEPLHVAAPGGP